jgi:regulator of sirC expression with transglutaminase-like and TPR domain
MRTLLRFLLLVGLGAGWNIAGVGAGPVGAAAAVPPGARSVAEIAELTRPSLVKITQAGREGEYGVGSGFVVSEDGLIVTNRHVIGEARRLKVEGSDGRVHEVTEVFAHDTKLDLAVLRVATKGLKPLQLGDSDAAKQGESIVAMGNPEGLAYSVVEGVISEPRRDVEGQPMIQVAIPIERGNSGGPLMDREGRVLGVLTLKSARTENLGFAMPTVALRKLLEKPNPIPMERWLTIGVLNPRFWTTVMGAQWTQRAGVVQVAQAGDGFGGRALCLWNDKPGEAGFEAAVTVRLADEAGAAGLAFCADGGARHYGFYPTGGRLRLTRFDGPDVFSWKILRELDSDAYRPGEWNTLRVRVEGTRIQCFVNGTPVLEMEDAGMRGGFAGLCKFRRTVASFKDFRTGEDVSEKRPSPAVEAGLRETVEGLLGGRITRESAFESLGRERDSSRRLLLERSGALEKEAALLRVFATELHQRTVREALVAELERPDSEADLLRCALLLSKHDNADLDVAAYERGFEQMVRELKGDPEIAAGAGRAIRRINRYLFEENGFHGSRSDYGNPSNSYLNEVLDDREGLPITLSVLYIELARRLGVQGVAGIPLPGRFMVGYREGEDAEIALVDVYEGGRLLTMEEGVASVSEDGMVPASAKRPAFKREILLRMVRNLLGPLMDSRNTSKEALPYLDIALALDPDAARERLARAFVRENLGERSAAAQDVRWMLEHLPPGLGEERRETLERWLGRLERQER